MAKLTHADVAVIAGKRLSATFSSKPMGLFEYLRKGLNGRQSAQTRASIEAVKKGKAPDFANTAADRFDAHTADQRKAIAIAVLCGRVPAFLSDGVAIAGPTVDAESLDATKRQAWQSLRAELAQFYQVEELRRLYPRSSDGVRASMEQSQDEREDNAPVTLPTDSTDIDESGGLE